MFDRPATRLARRSLTLVLAAVTLAGCGKGTGLAGTLVSRPAASAVAAKAAPVVPTVKLLPSRDGLAPAVPGELIVHFKGEARDLPGATRQRAMPLGHTFLYKVKDAGYSLKAVEDWEDADDIDYVEPNYLYTAVADVASTPNDPNFSDSWGVAAIKAPDVWGVSQGQGVRVAVVDTGVSANQPDLAGQVLAGVDLVNNDNDPTDDHGHGTHVAGTIAALANNGYGVAGVAPRCQIIPIKVLNASGQGSNSTIADGILKAAELGAKVINMSLGGPDSSETLRRAIAQVQAQGVVVVCAAGNDNTSTPFYPAACEDVIGVAAHDQSRNKASFSNYGDYIDISAPGVSISSVGFRGGLSTMSGTSMASPHVAGAAALLLSAFPQLKARHILHVMQAGGDSTNGFPMAEGPRALNVEHAFTQVAYLDLTAPSSVYGLAAAGGAPGEVQLTWSPAQDNRGVTGYRIWRDGEVIGTTAETRYSDTTLGMGRSGSYSITAFDGDGNEGTPSAPVIGQGGAASTRITDVKITKTTAALTVTWHTTVPLRCYLQWGTSAQLGNGTGWEGTPTTEHTATLSGLARFKQYQYRIVAADAASNLEYTNTMKSRTKLWWLFSL